MKKILAGGPAADERVNKNTDDSGTDLNFDPTNDEDILIKNYQETESEVPTLMTPKKQTSDVSVDIALYVNVRNEKIIVFPWTNKVS